MSEQVFYGSKLVGEISTESGVVDAELLAKLEELMEQHKVNYIRLGWCRWPALEAIDE